MSRAYQDAIRRFGNLVLAGGSLVFLLAQPAFAITVRGADGAAGVDGTNGADGGDGRDGETGHANVMLSNTSQSAVEAIGIGGDGGPGGRGSSIPPSDGGHGGAGGDGIGQASIDTRSGPAEARAAGTGGDGGQYGHTPLGATSGVGGAGGDGIASASAIAVDSSQVDVVVTALGGDGGNATRGIADAIAGGRALLQNAYGQSNGGPVRIDISAESGRGGNGLENTNGLFIGPGGHSRDVVVSNVADALTSGPITITQSAKAGRAGGGLGSGTAGFAVSRSELTKASQLLSINTSAEGGLGGASSYGSASGDGGDAISDAKATNSGGVATANSIATGGTGGSILHQLPTLGVSSVPAGNGGHATAFAEADGLHPSAHARASGGAAGFAAVDLGQIVVTGGRGGDAVAEAIARTTGNQSFDATASAFGGVGGNALSPVPGTAPSAGGRMGTAIATAIGSGPFGSTTTNAVGRTAIAQSRSVASGGQALARAQATRTIPANGPPFVRVERAEVDTSVASVSGIANIISASGGGRPPVPDNPDAQVIAIGVGRGAGRLYDIDFEARNIQGMTGSMTFTSEFDFEFDPALGLPDDLILEFSQPAIFGNGFLSLSFGLEVNNATTIPTQTFGTDTAAIAFFRQSYNLGPLSPGLDGKVHLDFTFDITLLPPPPPIVGSGASAYGGLGDGFHVGVFTTVIPEPNSAVLLGIVFTTLGGWRRRHTSGRT